MMATVTVIEKVADSHTQASKSFFAMADDVADYKKKYTDGESIVKVCDSLKLTISFFLSPFIIFTLPFTGILAADTFCSLLSYLFGHRHPNDWTTASKMHNGHFLSFKVSARRK